MGCRTAGEIRPLQPATLTVLQLEFPRKSPGGHGVSELPRPPGMGWSTYSALGKLEQAARHQLEHFQTSIKGGRTVPGLGGRRGLETPAAEPR